mgnify:FL=1
MNLFLGFVGAGPVSARKCETHCKRCRGRTPGRPAIKLLQYILILNLITNSNLYKQI